jgi:hypothetical protein
VAAPDQPTLDRLTRDVVTPLESAGIRLRGALFRQREALLAFLGSPRRRDLLLLTSSALARMYWFAYAADVVDPDQAIGVDLTGPRLYVPVRERRANASQFVLGLPGSGKSAFAKLQILRSRRDLRARAIVIDPEGEYRALATEVGDMLRFSGDVPWDEIWQRIEENRRQGAVTHLTVDEAHLLLTEPQGRRRLQAWVKRARKWGVLFTAVTQNVHDFLASAEGRTMLANAGEVFLFRQSPLDLDPLCRIYRLSPSHRDFLARADPGTCLVVDEQAVVPVQIVLRDDERLLVDTRPSFWPEPSPWEELR